MTPNVLWGDMDITPMLIGAAAEGSEWIWMGWYRSKTGRKTLRITASPYRELLHETSLQGTAAAPALKTALGEVETRLGKGLELRDHRQPVLHGKRHAPPVVRPGERVRERDQRVRTLAG